MIHSIVISAWLTVKFLIFACFMVGSIFACGAAGVALLNEGKTLKSRIAAVFVLLYVAFVVTSVCSGALWFQMLEAWMREGAGQ